MELNKDSASENIQLSPDCPLSTDVLLQNDGCRPHAQELPSLAPPPEVFLDGHAGSPQPVQTQLLQIRHLAGPEKDLCAAKLVLVGVLDKMQAAQMHRSSKNRRCSSETAAKAHLNHPLQHIFASLLLVAEVSFLLRHEDAVAAVKLDVCPPANVAIIIIIISVSSAGVWLEPGLTWMDSSVH